MPRLVLAPRLFLLVWCGTGSLSAQSVPVRTLAAPEARLDHEWTRIHSLRELGDGRLVVLDTYENVIMLVDARFTAATRIGREGQGPGEFANPSAVVPLGGDSTGVVDGSSSSLKIITPRGEPGGIIHPRGGAPCAAPGDSLLHPPVTPVTDGRGRFYTRALPLRRRSDGSFEQTDRAAIERWGSGCGRDTVAFLPHRIDPNARIMATGNRAILLGAPGGRESPFPTGTQWAVAPDGRVAIAHADPYRIDIVEANGTLRTGTAIRAQVVRVGEVHKEAWRDERRRPAPATVRTRDGATSRRMLVMPFEEPSPWPRDLPPFLLNAVTVGIDGRLWVQRTTADPHRPEFDVFDTAGRLVERVVFPVRSRLVGHGRGVVYLVRIDDDDLETLERHRVR